MLLCLAPLKRPFQILNKCAQRKFRCCHVLVIPDKQRVESVGWIIFGRETSGRKFKMADSYVRNWLPFSMDMPGKEFLLFEVSQSVIVERFS